MIFHGCEISDGDGIVCIGIVLHLHLESTIDIMFVIDGITFYRTVVTAVYKSIKSTNMFFKSIGIDDDKIMMQ